MELVTRKEAREKGATRFYTGKPCIYGHLEERMASNGACVVCLKAKAKPRIARWGKKTWAARYERSKAEYISRAKVWCKAHPDEWKAKTHRHRTRKRGAVGSHSASQIRTLKVAQGERCAACGCSIAEHHSVDHIIPTSRGGSNAIENIQLLCKPCNSSKCDKLMSEWRPAVSHG